MPSPKSLFVTGVHVVIYVACIDQRVGSLEVCSAVK